MLQFAEIAAAAERLKGVATARPSSPRARSTRCSAPALMKAENLQRMGAFVPRRLQQRQRARRPERARGVVASPRATTRWRWRRSCIGCRATIVMPQDAPA